MVFAIWSEIEKKYKIHYQFSVTSFTVSVKLWHKKSDFSTVFKITIDEMFFMKNHASFWNHHRWEHFHFFFRNCHFGSMKLSTFSLFWVKLWKKNTFFVKLTKLCRVIFKPNKSKFLRQICSKKCWSKKWISASKTSKKHNLQKWDLYSSISSFRDMSNS